MPRNRTRGDLMSGRTVDPDRWRMDDALYFYGRGTPFSNFRGTPDLELVEGWYGHPSRAKPMSVSTLEHYFQAVKASCREDFLWVMAAEDAASAKRRGGRHGEGGRSIELRPDWEDVKVDVMRYACRGKFALPEFREALLATGDRVLVENSRSDYVWGGRDARGGYGGRNLLGVVLMEVRAELRV
jgi:N-glycosidase YbiA